MRASPSTHAAALVYVYNLSTTSDDGLMPDLAAGTVAGLSSRRCSSGAVELASDANFNSSPDVDGASLGAAAGLTGIDAGAADVDGASVDSCWSMGASGASLTCHSPPAPASQPR